MGKAFKTVQGITLFSPAKVNLFFKVLAKRPDNYHEVASLNQVIDLGDEITIERSSQDAFTCSDPVIPLDHTNLVLKALALFRHKTALNFPVSIHLKKNIPIQAGLGGGSSNAATTLFGLQVLSGLDVDMTTLQEWSSFLGADVPFFFSEGTAYCTGRGECIENLKPLVPVEKLWIAKPQEGLSTPAVYAKVQIREDGCNPIRALEQAKSGHLVSFNDLEEAALSLLPSLEAYRQQLLQLGFSKVVMTGSGSAFMCFGEPKVGSDFLLYPVSYCRRTQGKWYEK